MLFALLMSVFDWAAGLFHRPDLRSTPPQPAGRWGNRAPRRADAPAGLEVVVSDNSSEAVVQIKGFATVAQADHLDALLLSLQAARPSRVILDLSELCFISVLAMGVLTTLRRGIVRTGGQVRLAPQLQPSVRESLCRAGLVELFGLEDGVDSCEEPRHCEVPAAAFSSDRSSRAATATGRR
jgi:anti-anti-sigma factor